MITTGETIAEAPRAFFGTLEKATPRIVETSEPVISYAAKVSQRSAPFGRLTPKNATPAMRRRAT